MGNFPEVFNVNRFFPKLDWFICTYWTVFPFVDPYIQVLLYPTKFGRTE